MRYLLLLTSFFAFAQVKVPAPSPNATFKETVGLTTVEVDYNRPSARGRIVFGNLVPFGSMWRTGANKNSMLSFSDDVTIEGQKLKKGTYAIFATPKADSWEIIFYTDTENWGTPRNFDENKVALKTNVKVKQLADHVETFTIGLNNFTNDGADINISWEKTSVTLKLGVPTQKIALESIKNTLAGPSAADYFRAAQYYNSADLEMKEALDMINKACDMTSTTDNGTPYWYFYLKSLIQHKNGDKKGAIESAKLSMIGAEENKNADYVKMNKDNIALWSK